MTTARPPGLFARLFEAGMGAVTRGYMRSLAWTLRFRRTVVALTVGLVGVTVWLYVVVPKDFFPAQDTGLIFGGTIAAPDTSFRAMMAMQERVVQVLMRDPAVAGSDYDPVKVLSEGLPTEAHALYESLKSATLRIERMGLAKMR